ncbi:MBL fold metallo-hydrolase [Psychromonas antarctica]|uniref:MBL fold metallo-hydrolase n=1 Tax=Psychromonas antarctica TaxID=67573 RepID=UPI001EE7CF31|nr:MBL fold metallo-hydrolase [Psychromonas antarctica]MCG6202284.1 MBL fold metallo-hydrolase [Psychromonas antarctica]
MISAQIINFFDQDTNTFSYIVIDPTGNHCAVIDSVLNYDAPSGRSSYSAADQIVDYVNNNKLQVEWLLETHVHADHLSAAPYLQQKLGGKIAIGEHITLVQETFSKVFNTGSDFCCDGNQFDHLFADNDTFTIGNLKAIALHTPGHTPACMSYQIGNCIFVGDTLFMPDYGTARCDFPGGNAAQLYRSIQKLYALPDQTRVFMCHDYKAPGRDNFMFETTIGEERAHNIHLNHNVSESAFINLRQSKDATLSMPKLILPSVQVNMRAGHFPEAEENGIQYLKIPLNKI